MGFFTDAYDLFVIGIVVAIITKQWHLSTNEISLVSSTTLAASAVAPWSSAGSPTFSGASASTATRC
jgi:hypothetical protein